MTTLEVPAASTRPTSAPLLRASGLSVSYARPRKGTHLGTGAALTDATLEVRPGEIVGIVGETGSGKTTLARAVVGLVRPAAGTIEFGGRDIGGLSPRELRAFRRNGQVQLVFQDPLRSLDPDLTVARIVSEPLDVANRVPADQRASRVEEALREVGLEPSDIRNRRPRELSGGQRQRVSLARAIVTRPQLLLCDEPVSALDVSNRNLVLNLLDRLRHDLGLAVVIIAHDLSSLAGIADRVAVFYRSRLVEQGPTAAVLHHPAHPYTGLLVASAPSVDARHRLRPADVRRDDPARADWPASGGCVFSDRCAFAVAECRQQPGLAALPGHSNRDVACHLATTWPATLTEEVPS